MFKIKRIIGLILVGIFMLNLFISSNNIEVNAAVTPTVTYSTHVQNIGDQAYVSNGAMAGTSGQSLRLESISIKLENLRNFTGSISYGTHVQNIGDQGNKSNGEWSGSKGSSLRLEAIWITLSGTIADYYDIFYRVHTQDIGWMGWAKNGERSGSEGGSKRLEGIEIQLLPKGQLPEGYMPIETYRNYNISQYVNSGIRYNTHVQNIGDMGNVSAGSIGGSLGKGLRMESLMIDGISCEYMTHIQNRGDTSYVPNGTWSGSKGSSLRLEALAVRLTGNDANLYDIYYRVHAQDYGWMGWAKNGDKAGTAGGSKRLEAFELIVVQKGKSAPKNTSIYPAFLIISQAPGNTTTTPKFTNKYVEPVTVSIDEVRAGKPYLKQSIYTRDFYPDIYNYIMAMRKAAVEYNLTEHLKKLDEIDIEIFKGKVSYNITNNYYSDEKYYNYGKVLAEIDRMCFEKKGYKNYNYQKEFLDSVNYYRRQNGLNEVYLRVEEGKNNDMWAYIMANDIGLSHYYWWDSNYVKLLEKYNLPPDYDFHDMVVSRSVASGYFAVQNLKANYLTAPGNVHFGTLCLSPKLKSISVGFCTTQYGSYWCIGQWND